MKNFLGLTIVLLASAASLFGNNIAVSAPAISARDTVANTISFQFDLTWENSWRTSTLESNWDAAWVFIKFKVDGDERWRHANLKPAGHTGPAGSTVTVPADLKGAFVHRSAPGIGNVQFNGVTLVWDYGASMISDNDATDNLEYAIHAIEMVNVPEGAYDLGDTVSTDSFFQFPFIPTGPRAQYRVTSEAAIDVGNSAGNLWYTTSSDYSGDQGGPIPAGYPKGFRSFYCMKYEQTVGQHLAFLNKLTYAQLADIGYATGPNSAGVRPFASGLLAFPRIGLEVITPGVDGGAPAVFGVDYDDDGTFGDGAEVPMFFYLDFYTYLDWAALRPMTELEFEKACRGTESATQREYAWGNSSLHTASPYVAVNEGSANEVVSPLPLTDGNGVCLQNRPAFSVGGGPLRAGAFAASTPTPNREQAGGSHYGIMELSGNGVETTIGTGTPAARLFDGTHGDGEVDVTPGSWPSLIVSFAELSFRGGDHSSDKDRMRVSDRFYASASGLTLTTLFPMGRGVRTAP